MSGTRWTPGPWSHDSGVVPPDGPDRYADIYVDGGEKVIASINEMRDFAPEEGRANARLIAEAPNLYDALEAQVAVSRRLMEKAGFSEASIRDCTAQARRALTRARGPS